MALVSQVRAPAGTTAGRVLERVRSSRDAQIVVGLVIVAAALRFSTLSSQSYWLDESQAVHELRGSFGAMLHGWRVAEYNTPLYLILGWGWARVFGTGEVGLRSLSALFGTAMIPLLYLAGRELVSRSAGLVAAALATINPFLIWYSQEAREYILMGLLCAASLLFFARAWQRRRNGDVVWWAVVSALALSTMYFSGFLIFGEGLLLVWRLRSGASVAAAASQLAVLGAWFPHVTPQLSHSSQFIVSQSLLTRLQQVPITFGLNTLYQGPLVHYGLISAAALAIVVLGLLLIGAGDRELSGAGVAALLAAIVIAVPLVLALLGHDALIARALMPAWPPLAIVVGAACTASAARWAGAALAVALAGLFVWAQIKITSDPSYQRPDWRGVATALGKASGTRAIVAYDGEFAAGPLSIYMPGIAWAGPGAEPGANAGPATISELAVVGDAGQSVARRLPSGIQLIGSAKVDGYRVDRFALARPWRADASAFGARALRLVRPAPPGPAVLIQRRGP